MSWDAPTIFRFKLYDKCEICKMLKRSLTRRYQRKDPHIETRVGHTWGFDLLQNKTESFLGSKYILVMRDFKTGYFKIKFLKTKDQVTPMMKECIEELRSDPRFKLPANATYKLVSELRCDPAGEQRDGVAMSWDAPTIFRFKLYTTIGN
eukprot:COSAG06_NODE_763_length_12486_cov_37.835244_3_plen_150_part_00